MMANVDIYVTWVNVANLNIVIIIVLSHFINLDTEQY